MNNNLQPIPRRVVLFLLMLVTSSTSAFVTPSTTSTSSTLLHTKKTAPSFKPHRNLSPFLTSPQYNPIARNDPSSSSTKLQLSLGPFELHTIFSTNSIIPLLPSFGLNAVLFIALKSKLDRMLTPEGYFHSLALGTLLWHTLGWRGWTTCVLYLFLGQLVTKVKFQEKEKMGIAEGRGGRRGPENVW